MLRSSRCPAALAPSLAPALLALCLSLPSAAAAEPPAPKPAPAKACPAPGTAAPVFTLPRARGGDEVSLRALLAQKRPVVLDFWRHDCTPCLLELPVLQKLAAEWGERAQVVTVHHGDPEEKMLDALEKMSVTLPTGFDSYRSVGDRYCVEAYPRTFVLDGSGVIRQVLAGDTKGFEKALRGAVEPLLVAGAKGK